jgi:hypothetical protein
MPNDYIVKNGRFNFGSSSRSYREIKNPAHSRYSVFENLKVDKTIDFLKKDGFSLGINLHQDVVREILGFAMGTPCYGNRKTNLGFYYSEKEQAQTQHGNPFTIGSYYNTALLCSAIKKPESAPILLEIAAKYLEAEPVHQGNQLWWSFAVESTVYERRRAAQVFQDDLDKCRLLKFCFYITDVDLCSSPHVCVRGSHVKKKLSHRLVRRGRSHQEITEYYGYENIVPICGKAGFGFVKDTACFHKGTAPSSKDRLTLEIQFALKDYEMPNDLREASQLECLL